VAVVLKGPFDQWEERQRASHFNAALCLNHEVVISLIFYTPEDFESTSGVFLHFVHRDGIRI
jgi:hypothetical protein